MDPSRLPSSTKMVEMDVRSFPERLDDGVVALRRPKDDDLTAITEHRADSDSAAWLSSRSVPFDADALLNEYLAGWRGAANRLGLTFAVVNTADDRLVGVIHVDPRDHEVAVSYGTAPEMRNRGIATRACHLIVEWALVHGYRRATLEIATDNHASQRVAEKCGFRVATARTVTVPQTGESHDVLHFVLEVGDRPS